MSDKDDSTLDLHLESLKLYLQCELEVRSAIEDNKQAIKDIAVEHGFIPISLKKMFIAYNKIEEYLKGAKQIKSKTNHLAYEAWLISTDTKLLLLPNKLDYQDITLIESSVDIKNYYTAKIAIDVFNKIRLDDRFWINGSYPKFIKKSEKETNSNLLARPAWKLINKLKDKNGFEEFPGNIQSMLNRLEKSIYSRLLTLIEECRILEQCVFDDSFRSLVDNDEGDRKKYKVKLLVKSYLRDLWDDKPYETFKKENIDNFKEKWDIYDPMQKFTGNTNARSKMQEIHPPYVKEHVSSQGPAYKSINEVFAGNDSSKFFEIPSYQRTYEWDESNVDVLFDDLFSFEITEMTPPLFLGTILLQEGPTGAQANEILDGQQRLLTISLLAIWICIQLRSNSHINQSERLVKKYLANYDEDSETLTPKIMPDPRDQKSYARLLQFASDKKWNFDDWGKMIDVKLSSQLLDKQLKNIDDKFGPATRIAGPVIDHVKICDLILRLFQVCHVCRFVLAHQDDPFDTFQRLNHRGKKLENADLLRSVVLQKLKKQNANEISEFYDKEWVDFENGVGKINDSKVDDYNKSILDKFFSCFVKTRRPGTKKNQTVLELTEYWKDKDPSNIVKELKDFTFYFKLIYYLERAHIDKSINTFGVHLSTSILRLSLANPPDDFGPFVIGILEAVATNECTKDNAINLIDLLSSWLIRHSIISVGATTLFGLQRVFNKTNWENLVNSKYSLQALLNAMDKPEFGLSRFADDEFKHQLMSTSIYNTKIARSIFFALDTTKNALGSGLALSKDDNRLSQIPVFTLEHIAPQNINNLSHWQHMKDHTDLINTVGNLVAVEGRLNSRVQRESIVKKAEEFYNQSNFHCARNLKVLLTEDYWKEKYLCIWGEKIINDRNKEAADVLADVFSFPIDKLKLKV